ncbi:Cytosolic Fe-S cluster assembly factor nar1 [Puccinia graminis f. sp. tritici]|uniref:Cytosolic Fe-S cluster assembly factor nar1 n=1 Tax=Puccinia graminis f. sp. tritici TaxID=56615 RepID=A0A5B0Q119_PUCGR|nr:Cytosolic Fe-S cluster assembly factor nar1 [Puccinia graminis f. sp. tritici]
MSDDLESLSLSLSFGLYPIACHGIQPQLNKLLEDAGVVPEYIEASEKLGTPARPITNILYLYHPMDILLPFAHSRNLIDLNDYLGSSQLCTKPNIPTTQQEQQKPSISKTQILLDDHPPPSTIITESLPKAQITLNDCLACSPGILKKHFTCSHNSALVFDTSFSKRKSPRFAKSVGLGSAEPIYHVCVMSCYYKKLEASRSDFQSNEGIKDVDCMLMNQDLHEMIQGDGFDILQAAQEMEESGQTLGSHPTQVGIPI